MNPENMLKGRMAETLVEELLRDSGNAVYRFGYEAILQNLTQINEKFNRRSETGEQISAMPDLVVIDKEGNSALVEVKFRKSASPYLYDNDCRKLEMIKNFWGSRVVFVNCSEKPYFHIVDSPYVDGAKKLLWRPLKEEASWKIDGAVYDKFEKLVEKYLSSPLLPETKAKLSSE